MGFIQHLSKGLHRISTQTHWFSVFIEVLEKPCFYLLLCIYRMAPVHVQPSQQTFVLMKTRRLWYSSSEDVFKTSSRRLHQDQHIGLGHMSSRRVQDVLKTSSRRFQDVLKTSSRHLQDVFKTHYQVKLFLVTELQDVFETYSKPF